MEAIDWLGIVAGVFTMISMLPQLIKTYKTKEVEDLSVPMLLVLITGVGLWVVYGVFKNDLPIILTNSASVLLNSFLLYLVIRYKE
jgi:MtN3 and saliva related transmembrane protein